MKYNKWVCAWFLWIGGILGCAFLLILMLERFTAMPLRFSKSISYDVKVKFAKNNLALGNYDTFVIGSSMALNNIDSAVLEASSAADKVLNLSSWGLATSECLQLLQMLDLQGVRRVVYASQYFDYVGELDKVLDDRELQRYLRGRVAWKTYFQNISRLPQTLWQYYAGEGGRALIFDANGDINFPADGKAVNKHKWAVIPQVPTVPVGEDYFKHLVAMQEYLSQQDIELVVITNPFRLQLLEQNEEFRHFFESHIDYLNRLAEQRGFVYIDAHHNLGLSDRFFVDASHLDVDGANRLTQLIADHVQRHAFSDLAEH